MVKKLSRFNYEGQAKEDFKVRTVQTLECTAADTASWESKGRMVDRGVTRLYRTCKHYITKRNIFKVYTWFLSAIFCQYLYKTARLEIVWCSFSFQSLFPAEARGCPLGENTQTGSGSHSILPSAVPSCFTGRKEGTGDHSHPRSAQVNNRWSCTSPPNICLHGMNWDNFTFPHNLQWRLNPNKFLLFDILF